MSITQEYLKSILHYDPDTGILTRLTDTTRGKAGDIAGDQMPNGYWRVYISPSRWYVHRLAFIYMTGSEPPEDVDHINGDTSDNRWDNLRCVSRQENLVNSKRSKANTSGVTGVSWFRETDQWRAQIYCKGRRYSLGLFTDWFDAVCARKAAEISHGFHPNHGR